MKQSTPEPPPPDPPADPPADIQRPVMVGDLYATMGRGRFVWTVRRLINGRNLPAQAEMSQVDGLGRVTVDIEDLSTEIVFKRISKAVS
jgi:hypothetical protein